MLLLFVLIAYVVGLKRHKMHFGKKFTSAMSKSYTNHVLQFTMWIVIIAYPPVSRRAIQYITCSEKIDGKQYLVQDYTLECFDGQWNEFFPFAVLALTIYPLGVPAFFAYKLWSRHDKLKDSNVIARYGFLYEMYRPGTYWWDVYEMLQKLLLTGLIVLIFPGKKLQVVIACLFDLLFLMNLLIQKPHNQGPTRNLAMMANMALTMTMYCGLVLVSVESTKNYTLLFDGVLVAMNGCVAGYAAYHVIPIKICLAVIKGRKEQKKKEQEKLDKKRRRSLLPSSHQDRAHHIVRSFSKKKFNMSQIIPKANGNNNDENHVDSDNGNTNTTAKLESEHLDFTLPVEEVESEHLDFTLPVEEVDVHHEITDEDHHNTHVNGVKGPHEL